MLGWQGDIYTCNRFGNLRFKYYSTRISVSIKHAQTSRYGKMAPREPNGRRLWRIDMRKYEAMYQVMKVAGSPLHYTEVAEQIRVRGLYQSSSKNWPQAVNADLSKIIRVMSQNGEKPWLRRVSSGYYELNE